MTFSNYFIFEKIVCVEVTFYQWGHVVMLIIRDLWFIIWHFAFFFASP